MFGALALEREPLQYADLWPGIMSWVREVGGFAAFGLLIWLVVSGVRRVMAKSPAPESRRFPGLHLALGIIAVVALGMGVFEEVANLFVAGGDSRISLPPWGGWVLTVLSGLAIVGATIPLLVEVTRFRWRRIWAIARLSFKEAVRRRVLWVFSALLLVFLFGSWFLPYDELRPHDQVRNYVTVVYWAMTPLLLVVAGILAAFSIPTDIRQQTIHTVLTKPVERFEIVLGRFLGYTGLMTLVLLAMTGFSLVYVARGVSPEAAAESFKARVPLYGDLEFEGTTSREKGENVGKEWDYRSYIAGPMAPASGLPTQYAIWNFRELPQAAGRDKVRCEFNFDVYRTTKGEENKGVFCEFYFLSRNCPLDGAGNPAREKEYEKEFEATLQQQAARGESATAWQVQNQLAKKYGFFKVPSVNVVNNHTLSVDLPAGLVEHAAEAPEASPRTKRSAAADERPPLRARVRCISRTQFLGMAKYDLYFRLDDPDGGDDGWRFALNFFKGAGGLWLRLCLVIGVATALSTYLTGSVAGLTVLFLFLAGMVRDFIGTLAAGTAVGGGPLEASLRLIRRQNLVAELEQTPTVQVATSLDEGYRWVLRRVMNVIPDVDRMDFADRVREGFDVSGGQFLLTATLLVGYLLPWGLLAYYLMKSREVASST